MRLRHRLGPMDRSLKRPIAPQRLTPLTLSNSWGEAGLSTPRVDCGSAGNPTPRVRHPPYLSDSEFPTAGGTIISRTRQLSGVMPKHSRSDQSHLCDLPHAKRGVLALGRRPQLLPSTTGHTAGRDRPSCRDEFQTAIVCALPLEYDAVSLLFDEFWDKDGEQYGRVSGDTNHYTTGRIGNHDVVLALLPNMGKAAAAGAAASFRSSYPNLKVAVLVGICGGAPSAGASAAELLLGDVVIGKMILQHDFGRQYHDKLVPKDSAHDSFGRPNKDIRGLIAILESEAGKERLRESAARHLVSLQAAAIRKQRCCDYGYPGGAEDKLFASTYRHRHQGLPSCAVCDEDLQSYCPDAASASCEELGCDESHLVPRKRLEMKKGLNPEAAQSPEIFVGRIASGDAVMKSSEHRDRIAREHNVLAFEMEGAGIWDEIPCIVIKGICDYADSHKNKLWQPFAAATAAAVTKAVLERYTPAEKRCSPAARETSKLPWPSGRFELLG